MATTRSRKRQKAEQPTVDDIWPIAKDMMNRSEKKMGAVAVESRRFRELFGVSPEVALKAWVLMANNDLIPDGATLKHWMWTLCFLKVYAKQAPMCALCHGVDHKTLHKWVWALLEAFVVLEGYVVRSASTMLVRAPD